MGFEGLGARLRARVRTPAAAAVDGALGRGADRLRRPRAWSGCSARWRSARAASCAGRCSAPTCSSASTRCCRRRAGCCRRSRTSTRSRASTGPRSRVQAPRAGIVGDPQVRAAARSVVKVLGTACGLGVEGSGWVAGDGLVVTNAHVVAGQEDTRVLLRGPRARRSTRRRSPSTRATTSRCCGSRGLDAPALQLAPIAAPRHLGRRARLPPQRALRRARRPARRDARGRHPGRLRRAARCGG